MTFSLNILTVTMGRLQDDIDFGMGIVWPRIDRLIYVENISDEMVKAARTLHNIVWRKRSAKLTERTDRQQLRCTDSDMGRCRGKTPYLQKLNDQIFSRQRVHKVMASLGATNFL